MHDVNEMPIVLQMASIDHTLLLLILTVLLLINVFMGNSVGQVRADSANALLPTPLMVSALATIMIGGFGVINELIISQQLGLLYLGMVLFSTFAHILTSLYIIPLFDHRLKNMVSLGDIVGFFYGRHVEHIVSIALYTFCVSMAALFLFMAASVCTMVLGLSYNISLLALILFMFSKIIIGGTKSMVFNDALKFMLLLCALSALSMLVINMAGGLQVIFQHNASNTIDSVKTMLDWNNEKTEILWCIAILALPANIINPPIVQRFLMFCQSKKLADIYGMGLLLKCVVLAMVGLIVLGMAQIAHYEAVDSNNASNVWQNIIPGPLGTVVFCVVLGLLMSNVDAFLYSGTLLGVRNIIPRYWANSEPQSAIKICFMITSGLTVLITMMQFDLGKFLLMQEAFLIPLVAIPLLFALFRFKVTAREFWLSNIAVLIVWSWCYIAHIALHQAALISTLVAASSFAIAHFSRYKGFVWVLLPCDHREIWYYPTTAKIGLRLLSYYRQLCRKGLLIKLHMKQHTYNSCHYQLFGFIFALWYLTPCFMWDKVQSDSLMIGLRIIGSILCMGLLFYPYWLPTWKPNILGMYWYITIAYCLPFMMMCTFALVGSFGDVLLYIVACVITTIVLMEPMEFVAINLGGVVVGAVVCKVILGGRAWQHYGDAAFYGICSLMVLAYTSGWCFLYQVRSRMPLLKLLSAITVDQRNYHGGTVIPVLLYTEALNELAVMNNAKFSGVEQGVLDKVKMLLGECKLSHHEMSRSAVPDATLANMPLHSVRHCVNNAIKGYQRGGDPQIDIIQHFYKDILFCGIPEYLQCAIKLVLKDTVHNCNKLTHIEIWTERNALHIKGYELNYIEQFSCLKPLDSRTDNAAPFSVILCKLFMESIGGHISCNLVPEQYTEVVMTFPKMGRVPITTGFSQV